MSTGRRATVGGMGQWRVPRGVLRSSSASPSLIAHAGAQQAAASSAQPTPAIASSTPVAVPAVVCRCRRCSRSPRRTSSSRCGAPRLESAVEHLRALPGVRSVALADRGPVRLGATRLRVLGVPLATIRGFTPSLTASSTALWHSVARGEITVAYANSRPLTHRLGDTVASTASAARSASVRVGAFATIGLPGAQALVSTADRAVLGLAARPGGADRRAEGLLRLRCAPTCGPCSVRQGDGRT